MNNNMDMQRHRFKNLKISKSVKVEKLPNLGSPSILLLDFLRAPGMASFFYLIAHFFFAFKHSQLHGAARISINAKKKMK